eukprot:gene12089-5582_t
MGIKGLSQLLSDNCPESCREDVLKNYFSRKIAIDASMSIYQFLISIKGAYGTDLQDENGEVTNHLQGLLYRTTKMLEYGIKPVFVFDGKPPEMKGGELEKRREKREKAKEEFDEAKEQGEEERVTQLSKRLIRVGTKENDECKKLLTLMGVPFVEAPCEAEAQCAELCRGGKVYATATEDMDALTFGTPKLGRHMTISEARKQPIKEYDLPSILQGLNLDMDQFIDMCILCGCDYASSIRGMGPKKALSYIQKYKTIEKVLEAVKGVKQFTVPDEFYIQFDQARQLFKKPLVTPSDEIEMKWKDPDEDGLFKFLVSEKGFEEKKVKNVLERIKKSRKQTNQQRISNFFTVTPKTTNKKDTKKVDPKKRKRDEETAKNKKKK